MAKPWAEGLDQLKPSKKQQRLSQSCCQQGDPHSKIINFTMEDTIMGGGMGGGGMGGGMGGGGCGGGTMSGGGMSGGGSMGGGGGGMGGGM